MQDKNPRQRKTHRKSRLGCGNCKLRSIKCDETHPTCTRCSSGGYTCNYNRSIPALQLALPPGAVFQLDLAPPPGSRRTATQDTSRLLVPKQKNAGMRIMPPPPPSRILRAPVAVPLMGGDYEMLPSDFAALDRFVKRSVWTLGKEKMRQWYGERALGLASSHPFLLHTFIAYTLLHDTYVSNSTTVTPNHRASLAFHSFHGTALFQQQLGKASVSPSSTTASARDAIWISASLLGAAAFAHVDTSELNAVWPLSDPAPMDLDWLKMAYGKRSIRHIADPSRPDSVFHLAQSTNTTTLPVPSKDVPIPPNALPSLFYTVFNLFSDPYSNPYHNPAGVIASILYEPISDKNAGLIIGFVIEIEDSYFHLLQNRDPRALLLLAYWYARTAHHTPAWWVRPRAEREGKAICVYLEKHCADDEDMMELLAFPKSVFVV